MQSCLKETVIRHFLMKTKLVTDDLSIYRAMTIIPFWGKLIERVMADHLPALLEETDTLEPIPSGFKLWHWLPCRMIS